MKKKLFKYIKIFVSMALILSLVAPSYASLSASDGSAFVTKAEFDSALADFNSRLTTFEAGINSKIDSQVTSYLDRNGIWSGKDQTLSDNARAGFISSWCASAEKSDLYCVCYDGRITQNLNVYDMTRTVSDIWGTNAKECTGTPIVIDGITKSGLVALDLEYRNFAAAGRNYTWALDYCGSEWDTARYIKKLEDVTYVSSNYWNGYMLSREGGTASTCNSTKRLTPLIQTKYELQIDGTTKYALTTLDYSATNVGLYQGISTTAAVEWYLSLPTDAHSTRCVVYFFVSKNDILKIKPTKAFNGSWTDLKMATTRAETNLGTVIKFHSAIVY